MKQVTLQIPDDKMEFFLTLAKELGLVVTQKNGQDIGIPNWHIKEVEKRLKNTAKKNYTDWESWVI